METLAKIYAVIIDKIGIPGSFYVIIMLVLSLFVFALWPEE